MKLTLNKSIKKYYNQSNPEYLRVSNLKTCNTNRQPHIAQLHQVSILMDCCKNKISETNDSHKFFLGKDVNIFEYQRQRKPYLSNKKLKIEVSLKKERNKSQLPMRYYHKLQSPNSKITSQNIKYSLLGNNNGSQPKLISAHNINHNTLKIQHKKSVKQKSIKPSINRNSNYNPVKITHEKCNKNKKLTLSSSFKSQIQYGIDKIYDKYNIQGNKISKRNEIQKDQSFTARLINIHGSINHYDLFNHSKIENHHKLMSNSLIQRSTSKNQNDLIMKRQYKDKTQQIMSQMTQFMKIPLQINIKQTQYNHYAQQIEERSQKNMKKYKPTQRRQIGQYISSIENINQNYSGFHQDDQSFVLQGIAADVKNNIIENLYAPVYRSNIKIQRSYGIEDLNISPQKQIEYMNISKQINNVAGQNLVSLTQNSIYEDSFDQSQRQ